MKVVDVRLHSDQVYIAPLGDLQATSSMFSQRHWDRAVQRIERYDEHVPVHIIGMGDYVDFASPSNRQKIKDSHLYNGTQEEIELGTVRPGIEKVIEMWPDVETDVLLRGHHWFYHYMPAYENEEDMPMGFDTDSHMAAVLGCPVSNGTIHVRYHFPDGRQFNVLAYHGTKAGGVYGLNAMNAMVRRASGWNNIDLILAGHSHQLASYSIARMEINEDGDIVNRPVTLVNTGAFLKGYNTYQTTYVEEKELPPLALGHALVQVSPGLGDEEFEVGVNLRW